MSNIWFPEDLKGEWLRPLDIVASIATLSNVDERNDVLEIGVWKATWTLSILKNTLTTRVVGVDPYPGLGKIREEMRTRIINHEAQERFSLYANINDIEIQGMRFGLVHVDGEHSEKQTYMDLVESNKLLSLHGAIVVDDVNVDWFPGVSSAMYKFMQEYDFRMFLMTSSKAYLARKDVANNFYESLYKSELLLKYAELYTSHPFKFYEQDTSVLGQKVLIGKPKKVI